MQYAGVMTSYAARMGAALTALAAALVLSSCTDQAATATHDGHTDHQHGAESTAAPDAGHNSDDISFATMMIPHHEQAVELSALAPDRTTDPELLALAAAISHAQQPEIDTMKGFLTHWGVEPATGADGHDGHGMAMQGMVDDATMARLESLRGAEFDTLWLESMISHHQGAVEMAKAEIANGENADAIALAHAIVGAQEAEIGQMKQMLSGG